MASTDDMFDSGGGGSMGLGIAAGILKGINSQLVPWANRRAEAKMQDDLARKKEMRKAIASKVNDLLTYQELAQKKGQPKTLLFDPQNNPTHEAAMRFLADDTPINAKVYQDFMSTPTPFESLLDEGESRPQEEDIPDLSPVLAGTSTLGSGRTDGVGPSTPPAGTPLTAQLKQNATADADPTAGNMYGDYDPATRTLKPAGAASAAAPITSVDRIPGAQPVAVSGGETVTLPGGGMAEAPTTPGEVLVPPGTPPPVEDPRERTGPFQKPAPGTPDREAGLTLLERLRNRGASFNTKTKALTIPGKDFAERTDMKADDALTRFRSGVPWSEVSARMSPAEQKAARPIAIQMYRAQLQANGYGPEQIDQALAREFGEKDTFGEFRAKEGIKTAEAYPRAAASQRAALDYAGRIAEEKTGGTQRGKLGTPTDLESRAALTAIREGLEPGTPEYNAKVAAVKAEEAGTVAKATGTVDAELKAKYGESEFANAVREFDLKLPLSPADSALVRATLERQNIIKKEGEARATGEVGLDLKQRFEEFKKKLDVEYGTDIVSRAIGELGFKMPLDQSEQAALSLFLEKNEVKQAAEKAGATTAATENARLPYVLGQEMRGQANENRIDRREYEQEIAREGRADARTIQGENRTAQRNLATEGRANTEFRARADYQAGLSVGTTLQKEKNKQMLARRAPVGGEAARTYVRAFDGTNPPANMPLEKVEKRYIKLREKDVDYLNLAKTLSRDFKELRTEFNRVYKSDAPLVNWAKEKTGRAAGVMRRLDSFKATIGQFAQFGGESARRVTDRDAERFLQGLGLDTGYIAPTEANAVFDRFERKLAGSIHDIGINPRVIGLGKVKPIPRAAPERVTGAIEEVQ